MVHHIMLEKELDTFHPLVVVCVVALLASL